MDNFDTYKEMDMVQCERTHRIYQIMEEDLEKRCNHCILQLKGNCYLLGMTLVIWVLFLVAVMIHRLHDYKPIIGICIVCVVFCGFIVTDSLDTIRRYFECDELRTILKDTYDSSDDDVDKEDSNE